MDDAGRALRAERIGAAEELEIAPHRPDGTRTAGVPVWVVAAGGELFVRTWHRRATGWYGRALASGRAHVRVPGAEADVLVEDVGGTEQREAVDAAYRRKYGRYGAATIDRMVAPEAAATTLRLVLQD